MFVPMNYERAHEFVRSPRQSTREVRWEGWDMVFFTPVAQAWKQVDGVFHNGRWGFETRISVLNNGSWEVPGQYVSNTTRRARARHRRN